MKYITQYAKSSKQDFLSFDYQKFNPPMTFSLHTPHCMKRQNSCVQRTLLNDELPLFSKQKWHSSHTELSHRSMQELL